MSEFSRDLIWRFPVEDTQGKVVRFLVDVFRYLV
jgi:hypothetical protein